MDRRIIIIVFLVFLIFGFGWFYVLNTHDHALVASGTIEATEVTVSSKVVGRVIDLKVDDGSSVKQGDVIALIETSEAAANLKNAQAKFNIARDDLERNRQLFRDKMISPQQYDAARSAADVAAAQLETAKLLYDNTTIMAPISGVVLVKAIEKGELASVGTPIVTLADLSIVKLIVYLAEQNVGKVALGEDVSVAVDTYPDQKFVGKVTYISDTAEFTPKSIQTKEERATQVFGIKIEIANPDQKLKPGMPADAQFKWTSQ